jgi:hypothetical protein
MPTPQLKLISPIATTRENSLSADPVRRIFDYWVFMARKMPQRAKLGSTRRQAIAAALLLYSEEDLELAIEGNLVDEWCVANGRHDIDWLLAGESRIERFMDAGERLREASAARDEAPPTRTDPVEVRQAMERNRARLDAVRGHGSRRG